MGVAPAKDLLRDLQAVGKINLANAVRDPLIVHESLNVVRLMEQLVADQALGATSARQATC